jgi:hypothetical protein
MRPLLAFALGLVVLGSVQAYMSFVNGLPKYQSVLPVEAQASGQFRLELTLSQDAQPDAFEAISLLVTLPRQGDRVIIRSEEVISCADPIVIDSLAGFVAGDNELFIQVGVGDVGFEEAAAGPVLLQPAAIRIQLFRDHEILVQETLWGAPGEPIQGKVVIRVPEIPQQDKASDHEH